MFPNTTKNPQFFSQSAYETLPKRDHILGVKPLNKLKIAEIIVVSDHNGTKLEITNRNILGN